MVSDQGSHNDMGVVCGIHEVKSTSCDWAMSEVQDDCLVGLMGVVMVVIQARMISQLNPELLQVSRHCRCCHDV